MKRNVWIHAGVCVTMILLLFCAACGAVSPETARALLNTEADAARLAERLFKLRIFEDDAGKTNRSIVDIGGSVIVVSQFTLYADTAHGNRPGFSAAARPELAVPLYESFVAHLRELLGAERVQTGRFGADMKVRLLNDGPFTVELAS